MITSVCNLRSALLLSFTICIILYTVYVFYLEEKTITNKEEPKEEHKEEPKEELKEEPKEKYLLTIAGCGPTTQIFGFREGYVLAKFANRTLVIPQLRKERTAEFFDTQGGLNISFLNNYYPTISSAEWAKSIGQGTLFVQRFSQVRSCYPGDLLEYVLKKEGVSRDIITNTWIPKWLKWQNEEEIVNYFKKFSSYETIIFYDMSRSFIRFSDLSYKAIQVVKYFVASNNIKEEVQKVAQILKLNWNETLSVHWRHEHSHGEFSFGTEITISAKFKDVQFVLSQFIQHNNITKIYLATASEADNFKRNINLSIPIFSSQDVPIFQGLDSQIISFIEQEICRQARFFVGTRHSTWTEFVRDYRISQTIEKEYTTSFDELLELNHLEFTETRESWLNDEESLNNWLYYPIMRPDPVPPA